MKKIIIRIVGSLCILSALAAMIFPTWVKLHGVTSREVVEERKFLLERVDWIQERFFYGFEQFENLGLEDKAEELYDTLKENGLPYTEKGLKKAFKEAKAFLKEMVDEEISLKKVFIFCVEAPRHIEQMEKLLQTKLYAVPYDDLFDHIITKEGLELLVGIGEDYGPIVTGVSAFLVFMLALGLAAAITHNLNKARFLKYIFLLFLVVLVVGLTVGLPILSAAVIDYLCLDPQDLNVELLSTLELRVTAMPYFAVILAMVPIVLDIIFERKEKKKEITGG